MPARRRPKPPVLSVIGGVLAVIAIALIFSRQLPASGTASGAIAAGTFIAGYVITGLLTGWK